MKIGVYGGTFNPIHLGHVTAARCAVEMLKLDRLYLIPDGRPPHKNLDDNSPLPEDRMEMVRLAAESMGLGDVVRVSDLEMKRKGKSYTVDTIQAVREKYPKDEIYLLMGTDMFLTFQAWKDPDKIAKLCRLCAFGRSETDTESLFAVQRAYLHKTFGAKVTTIALPNLVEISSTALRRRLADLSDRDAPKYLVPAVYGYILRHNLYGTHADLKRLPLELLRPAALSHLSGSRIPHVLGTEETAAALAKRWGADEEEARRAALLHDCTKKLRREEHLALCRMYGIETDPYEAAEAKLLHAKTGAAVARAVYGVSDQVHDAILWHTTGKADMTLLEKIIYLADYIEPTRDFCDLTQLRKLAMEDLDRALLLGLTMAVDDLGRKGMVLHPNSVAARDYLKGRLP